MQNIFYVYEHYTQDTNQVFYVGYGRNGRAYDFVRRNSFWKNVYLKHGTVVKIIKDNLTLEEAIKLECELIKTYGRKDLNSGTLVNLTDGGEGLKNVSIDTRKKLSYIASHISEETREKMRTSAKNRRPMTEETKQKLRERFSGTNNPNYGKIFSEEHRKRLSESHKGLSLSEEGRIKVGNFHRGRKRSMETRKKISEALKGNKNGVGVVRKGIKYKKTK